VTLIAGKHLRIGDSTRAPGDPVPEFETDPARRRKLGAYLADGRIIRTDEDGAPVGASAGDPIGEAAAEARDRLHDDHSNRQLVVERAAERHGVVASEVDARLPDPPTDDGDAGVDLADMGVRDILAGLSAGALDADEVLAYEQQRPGGPRKTIIDQVG